MSAVEILINALISLNKETSAAKWLKDLPTYNCSICKEETVFNGVCLSCQEDIEKEDV